MSLFNWVDSFVKRTTVWDIVILKLLLFVTGLIFGAYYSVAVLKCINWWYGAFIVLFVVLLFRVFKK